MSGWVRIGGIVVLVFAAVVVVGLGGLDQAPWWAISAQFLIILLTAWLTQPDDEEAYLLANAVSLYLVCASFGITAIAESYYFNAESKDGPFAGVYAPDAALHVMLSQIADPSQSGFGVVFVILFTIAAFVLTLLASGLLSRRTYAGAQSNAFRVTFATALVQLLFACAFFVLLLFIHYPLKGAGDRTLQYGGALFVIIVVAQWLFAAAVHEGKELLRSRPSDDDRQRRPTPTPRPGADESEGPSVLLQLLLVLLPAVLLALAVFGADVFASVPREFYLVLLLVGIAAVFVEPTLDWFERGTINRREEKRKRRIEEERNRLIKEEEERQRRIVLEEQADAWRAFWESPRTRLLIAAGAVLAVAAAIVTLCLAYPDCRYCRFALVDERAPCQKGFVEKDGKCVPLCPKGFVEKNGKCEKVVAPCPQGEQKTRFKTRIFFNLDRPKTDMTSSPEREIFADPPPGLREPQTDGMDAALNKAVAAYNEIVKAIPASCQPRPKIRITGHTDTLASKSYNDELSDRRANLVKEKLVAKGVPAEAIETVAAGEVGDQEVTTGDEVAEPANRRGVVEVQGTVDIDVVGPTS
jgi:hypothetical protein